MKDTRKQQRSVPDKKQVQPHHTGSTGVIHDGAVDLAQAHGGGCRGGGGGMAGGGRGGTVRRCRSLLCVKKGSCLRILVPGVAQGHRPPLPTAYYVIYNATVHTVDAARPSATAFAVQNGTFVDVGTDDVVRQRHPDAEVVVQLPFELVGSTLTRGSLW